VLQQHSYAFSEDTFRELTEVILREKFDPFIDRESRIKILNQIAHGAEWFAPTSKLTDCRDPADNKFLELATTAAATHIISGDQDLLELCPYKGIHIVSIHEV